MENLKYLKDVMALENVIQGLKQASSEELKRIAFLEKQRIKKDDEITQLKQELSNAKDTVTDNEKAIFDLEKKLEQNCNNLTIVTTEQQEKSLTESINRLEAEFDELQDKTLTLLEEIEAKEALADEAQGFVKGVSQTIIEIQDEVEKINLENQSKIDDFEKQISGLLSEVPSDTVTLYKRASVKHPHDAATFIVGQSCGSCKFTYAAAEVATFNQGVDLIQCKGCQRLLLPAPLRNI